MIFSNIRNKRRDNGFTIVELLIVIVVIGILAGITIVAYSGITARANTTKAQTNATSVQSVAESMNADNGYYPRLTADFVDGSTSTKLPSGIKIVNTAGTNSWPTVLDVTNAAAQGLTTVTYQYCGATAAPAAQAALGGRIRYWDFSANALSATIVYVGTGSGAAGIGDGSGDPYCDTWVTPAT